jgi:hypothetical protein
MIYHHFGTMIINGTAGIVIGDSTTRVDRCEIFINEINGQDKTRDGIVINNGAFNRISFTRLYNCRYGIILKQETQNVVLGENVFLYMVIQNCQIGFYIPAPPAGQTAVWAEGTQLLGGFILDCNIGVKIDNGAHAGGLLIYGVIDNVAVPGSQDYVNNMDPNELGSTLLMKFIRAGASIFHPSDIVLNPESREIFIGGQGRLRIGNATISTEFPDITLFSVRNPLVLRGAPPPLRLRTGALTDYILDTFVDGVTTYYPFLIRTDGRIEWGSGTSPTDVILSRVAPNLLALDTGDGLRVPGAIRTFVKAGAPTDADIPNPEDGAIVVDTLNSKLWVRVGGVWKSVGLI